MESAEGGRLVGCCGVEERDIRRAVADLEAGLMGEAKLARGGLAGEEGGVVWRGGGRDMFAATVGRG